MNGNSKQYTSGNSLSQLGGENKDICATCTSQMLLGKVYLHLQGRLLLVQRAEKVVSDSPGLVDFGIGPAKFFNNNNNNNLLLIRRKYLYEYIQMRLTSYIKIIIK